MSVENGPKGEGRNLLANVEVLRFFASFFVLVEHLFLSTERGYIEGQAVSSPLPILWKSGVDIFFIISGFIMLHVSWDSFGKQGVSGQFLLRRLIRIAPLYWIFTTVMVAVMLVVPWAVNQSHVDWPHVAMSYLFLPWPRISGDVQPVLGPGWTLNYEMLFYAIFAVGLLLRRGPGLLAMAAIFACLLGPGRIFASDLGPFAFWTNPIILEFLMGVGLAAIYRRGIRIGHAAQIALVALGLVAGGFAEMNEGSFGSRWAWAGLPSLLIAAGFILGPELPDNRLRRFLVMGGAASYALYLTHLFSLRAFGIVWKASGIEASGAYIVLAGVVALGAAVAVHLTVEKPVLRWMLAWLRIRGDQAKLRVEAAAAP